jgi:hypothetical protein
MLPDPNDDRRFRGYTVTRASHWVFYGTHLANGNEFPHPRATNTVSAILGSETDAAVIADGSDPPVVTGEDGTPKNFLVLARADLSDWPGSKPPPPSLSPDDQNLWLSGKWGSHGEATMGIYQRNGTVFTAATINWAGGLGLDGDGAVDQITRNVIRRLQRPNQIQVMYWNRDQQPGSGRVMIVDYSGGQVPGQQLYLEKWGDSDLLDGWEDDGDRYAVGDFLGMGHDQVMYWNRDQQPGSGRVMIVDYSGGQVPGQQLYLEKWGDSDLLDGWEDDKDWQVQGSFILR